MLGTSIASLLKYIVGLLDTPSVLSVVILTSYTTWSRRSMYWDRALSDAEAKRLEKRMKESDARRGTEDDDIEEDEQMSEETLNADPSLREDANRSQRNI